MTADEMANVGRFLRELTDLSKRTGVDLDRILYGAHINGETFSIKPVYDGTDFVEYNAEFRCE